METSQEVDAQLENDTTTLGAIPEEPAKEETEKKKRSPNKDRSAGKYSEQDFLNLPREKQLQLANKYLLGRSDNFDDGTFQFSYSHFSDLCFSLGFKKAIVDADVDNEEIIVYIDHGNRKTVELKRSVSVETKEKLVKLLGNDLTKAQKSKAFDALLNQSLEFYLQAKSDGRLHLEYRPTETTRIF